MIDEKYYRLIVEFFHALPHLNMYFHKSSSEFDPNSSEYLEVIHLSFIHSFKAIRPSKLITYLHAVV